MERRVLIAIFLSFLVLYAYQALVVKPAPKPATTASQSAGQRSAAAPTSTKAPAAPAAQPNSQPAPSAHAEQAPAAAPHTEATPVDADTTERDVRVETPDVIAVFTNRGARLKSWRLKRYHDQRNEPQELIESEVSNQPLPFTLKSGDEALDATLNGALYKIVSAPQGGIVASPAEIHFEYRDSAGVHAVKTFRVTPGSYVLAFNAQVMAGDKAIAPAIVWGPAVGDIAEVSRYIQKAEGILFEGGKVQRLAAKDIAKQSTYEGDFEYAGVDDNYFMTTAIAPGRSKVSFEPVTIPPPPGSKNPARDLVSYTIATGRAGELKFFIGPKDFDVLAAISPNFTRAINFGMFSVIVVPLLRSLKWLNGYIGNYGWSIVALTLIINALLFPLQHKSIVSMRKMQEIQPETKAIQERYAKFSTTSPERQKMNQELMALYRERGVNPASGCVPMLLTMPVFFAMWALLSTAIELRGAPFGWIHDLTARDPYYVWPVLMGVTQFVQQKMTPQTGVDPAQQRMMMVMPVVMSIMFFWMPAGALIYYTVSALVRIGQQYLTNYLIGPPPVRTVRPAAERRLKRVGGGTTGAAGAKGNS